MFSLATIVTSKTRLEVLELFIKNPTLELGVRETARRLDSNVMAVRNELVHLQIGGVLKCRKVANSVQYSLDNACMGVGPLRALFEMGDAGAIVAQTTSNSAELKNSKETRER